MRYKPYLDAHLELGFASFQTEIWHYSIERRQLTYINIRWQFFKWHGQFRLYKPGEDISREKKK
jgi:hypothetical protein